MRTYQAIGRNADRHWNVIKRIIIVGLVVVGIGVAFMHRRSKAMIAKDFTTPKGASLLLGADDLLIVAF